jgi:hypothetical protein
MDDQQLEEKFHQTTLQLERIAEEFVMLRLRLGNVETKLDRVKDELTLPSGRMNERFLDLERQIRQIGPNSSR